MPDGITRRLWRKATVTLAGCFVSLWFSLGVVGVVQARLHDSDMDTWRQHEREAQFYELVAEANTSTSPTVDARLARDLRERLDGPNPQEAIAEFRGTSNRYGGITDAIGFDPFNRQGLQCSECGPLDTEVQQHLLRLRDGGIESVTDDVRIPRPDGRQPVMPFVLPLTAATWLGSLALWVVARLEGYRVRDLSFDRLRTFTFPLAAGVAAVSQQRVREKRVGRVRESFPDHMRLVDEIDRLCKDAPSDHPRVVELRQQRDALMADMFLQTTSSESSDIELDFMAEQVNAAREYFEARAEANKELRQRRR